MSSDFSPAAPKRVQNYGTTVVNVNHRERLISIVAGSLFIVRALKKNSLLSSVIGGFLVYRGASGHCPLYSQIQRSKYTDRAESVNIQTTLIVNKPKSEVYDFWRKLENLPLFMKHLASVREADDKKSHWEANLPGNVTTIGWDAKIVKEEENTMLSWKSLPGATIENAGKVTFKDALGHQGTELGVMITYRPPAGKIGSGLAWLLNPLFTRMIEDDIKNFKVYIETGSVEKANG